MSDLIRWNRRTLAAIAVRKAWTSARAFVLGQGLSVEAEDWVGPQLTLHGTEDDGASTAVRIWGCPICAALVLEANRAYHERWHIAGSI